MVFTRLLHRHVLLTWCLVAALLRATAGTESRVKGLCPFPAFLRVSRLSCDNRFKPPSWQGRREPSRAIRQNAPSKARTKSPSPCARRIESPNCCRFPLSSPLLPCPSNYVYDILHSVYRIIHILQVFMEVGCSVSDTLLVQCRYACGYAGCG